MVPATQVVAKKALPLGLHHLTARKGGLQPLQLRRRSSSILKGRPQQIASAWGAKRQNLCWAFAPLVEVVPNKALEQTGHAIDGFSRFIGFSRVSRRRYWIPQYESGIVFQSH